MNWLLFTLSASFRRSRSSPSEVLLGKGLLKICSKFTGKHLCRSATSIKLQSNFIEIALRHGCSPVNLLHIFRKPFPKNTSGWLLLEKSIIKQILLGLSLNIKIYSPDVSKIQRRKALLNITHIEWINFDIQRKSMYMFKYINKFKQQIVVNNFMHKFNKHKEEK